MVGLVAIDGTSDCPDAAAVARELQSLAATTAAHGAARVQLRRDGDALVIEQRRAGGERATRRLALGPSCADLAAAAAVVIASWQTELPAAAEYDVDLGNEPALTAPGPARRGLGVAVGGAFVASFAPAFAAGAAVDATFAPGDGSWAARLALSGSGTRDLAFAGGSAAWTRFGLALGPALRLRRGRWQLDLHAEAVAGLLYVAGHGFDGGRTAWSFDPGLGGGVRGAVWLGPVAPFLGVGVVGWLRPEEVALSGGGAGRMLPAVELLVSAGLAFGNVR
jgi:hypothetical protein